MPIYSYVLPLTAHVSNPFDLRYRDHFPMHSRAELAQMPIPNLDPYLSPVRDQNVPGYGECADESFCGILDALYRQHRDEALFSSSLFCYEAVRQAMGTPTQDTGSRLRVTQYVGQTLGVCESAMDPDVKQDFLIAITPAMLANAGQHKIAQGYWAPTLDEVLNALMAGHLVHCGLILHQSFESAQVAQTGIVPMPGPHDPVAGGHGMYWRASPTMWQTQRLRTRNSWSSAWGQSGDCEIPFAYVESADFMSARVYVL